LITLHDAPALAPAQPAARIAAAAGATAAARLVNGALFLTILISPLVFIEPSPYEAAIIVLGLVCIAAKIGVDRRLLPLIWLLLLWNVGGAIALLPVIDQPKTMQYVAVSLFLAVSGVMYAALFAQDTMARLAVLRRAYIAAAFLAAAIGIVAYFNLLPGAGAMFAPGGRANSTFKDPNVFGPFLILPLLLLLQSLLSGRIRPGRIVALLVILFGLLLSFSRGAWMHFGLSASVAIVLMFFTAPDMRSRGRLVLLAAAMIAALAALVVLALSFEAVGEMFKVRARLVQDYDAGTSTGRFLLQILSVDYIINTPWGLGPYEFSRLHSGMQQHNVYLHAFLVYGWLGGLSYLVLTLTTLARGLRAAFVAAPSQPFLIAAFATFVGVVVEGAVIDTDHWRHYFLLLGLIWGLSTASARQQSRHALPGG
jgi:O-antigen ligase